MTGPLRKDLDQVDFAFDEMPGRELHAVLHAFRERGPIQPTRFLGVPAFVITSHGALRDAFMDVQRFPPHRMYQASFEGAIGKSFISMESPDQHRIFRKLATPAFRSRAVEHYQRDGLALLANELIDLFGDRSEFDLVAEYCARYPYLVISRLLGLPRDREASFHRWALALLRFRDDPAAARDASLELTAFLAPVVADRRRDPRDDVISGLVAARAEGRALSDEEVFSHVRLLFPTGGETTHGSLGNLLYTLLTRPDDWQRLRRDPDLIPAAVDELLRFETPIAVLPRMSCNVACEFHGVRLPPDSWVLFAIAGANRDPGVFRDPDRFDIDRDASDSLAFGRGVKACPGMHLARKNLEIALATLLERVPDITLIDAEASLPRRTVLRSPDALRVKRR